MLELRADYAAQLPGTVAAMEDLWRRLVAAEIPLTQLETLVRLAHGVAGSGATFDVPEASRVARQLELLLDAFRENGRLPEAAGQKGVADLLAELKQTAV